MSVKSVKLLLALSNNAFMEEEIKHDPRLSSNPHIGSGFCPCVSHLIRRKEPHRNINFIECINRENWRVSQ